MGEFGLGLVAEAGDSGVVEVLGDELGFELGEAGNLLVLGERGGRPVLGAPGCARSPKENGFDWVLDCLIAGVPVTEDDIAGMGVGGLLMEIPARPQPREPAEPA